MKFSLLLPTRNRLTYLKFAIDSVLSQDYLDWEIVVSDNASEENLRSYIESINDRRIIYSRTDDFLPVTENWNRALAMSTGDYVLMLGDDDALLGNCLSTAARLIARYERPELIYAEAVQFQYPNVMPGQRSAFIQFGYCEFLTGKVEPFFLDRDAATRVVKKSMSFKIAFGYNMQHTFIKRGMINKAKNYGAFFQSPYPDYYATNALFLLANEILVCPRPLVAIGISPKSFGFYYVNDREKEGTEFLRNEFDESITNRMQRVILRGTNMNTSWLLAMETLRVNLGDKFDLIVSHWRYRFMQFRYLYRQCKSTSDFLSQVKRSGTLTERAFWYSFVFVFPSILSTLSKGRVEVLKDRILDAIHKSHPRFDPRKENVCFTTILELCENAAVVEEIWRG